MARAYLKSIQGLAGATLIETLDDDKLLTLVLEIADLDRKPVDDVERLPKIAYEQDPPLRFKKLASALIVCLNRSVPLGDRFASTW